MLLSLWSMCTHTLPHHGDHLPALCGPAAFALLGPLPGVGDLAGCAQIPEGNEEMEGGMEGVGDERCMGWWVKRPSGACK